VSGISDDEAFAAHGRRLAEAVEQALPGWVRRSVQRAARAGLQPAGGDDGFAADLRAAAAAAEAGHRAAAEVGTELRALLALDVDQQRVNPMTLLRAAVRYPTAVLRDAGVAPPARDPFAERSFPDDPYDLTPATFGDVDPDLAEPGLVWGAAKAHVHLRRHKRA
jgi:hypothetical protein